MLNKAFFMISLIGLSHEIRKVLIGIIVYVAVKKDVGYFFSIDVHGCYQIPVLPVAVDRERKGWGSGWKCIEMEVEIGIGIGIRIAIVRYAREGLPLNWQIL